MMISIDKEKKAFNSQKKKNPSENFLNPTDKLSETNTSHRAKSGHWAPVSSHP